MPLAGYAQDRPRLDFAGSVTWIGQVPILVAIKKGFFKEQGIDVDVQVIVNSSDRIRALTAGDAAFSNLGRVAVISEMARGNESFSFFANVDDSPGQEGCWARPGITSVADLKGKAVAANSSAEITLAGLLADAGLKLGDLDYRNLPATEMAAALSHGDIEAACVWQPLLTRLKEAVPQGKLLGTDRETEMFRRFGTMAAGDIVIVSREVVEKYPNQARAIAAGVLKGADLTIENPQEAAAMVAEYFKQSPEEMLKAIQSFQYFGSKDWENHLKKHTEQMQYLADMLHEAGKIPERPDTAKWLDTSFVPKGN
ncbi:ABC transporter substrate-binding protein [Agrobacterium vitis]|uniref:ABC transporter substrate-binding protein n=2 Tax=Agrobacterium vitis TaxID=373 RepID=A0A368NYY6_AGRVI|nr:ABC transporter substrate-binding protein [Agrobacterium vitis]KAA3513768.1 ABC transporter substrate-binding protein [Agrobacterium vitis]KAA3528551.1 ABC transporter substrate-binding protein [Agrobacterium vitis]MCM2467319.1 ABC transporter substrate-binding protein [Agrobacterium vitis]MUO68776.1 ABC transporter substrate-binding protein [Agrobacterium vitis]MUO79809.1 ABC transporter substrate-binding protein [Agrobacterium vitis]